MGQDESESAKTWEQLFKGDCRVQSTSSMANLNVHSHLQTYAQPSFSIHIQIKKKTISTSMLAVVIDESYVGKHLHPYHNLSFPDTIYTERYMGLPTNESNWVGYEAGNVMSRVNNFRHKLFYLIHGSADDNVHFQQSMMLTRALELADITFFQQVPFVLSIHAIVMNMSETNIQFKKL